jgi:hypothetical protein
MASNNRGKDLAGSGDLHWTPSEGIYGLAVKTGDTYQLPYSSFVINGDKQGGGCFLLRVKPAAEGTLFTGSFKAAGSPGNALTMSVIYGEQSLQLILESEGLKAAGSLPLDMFLEDRGGNSTGYPVFKNFITLETCFYLEGNTFTAAMIVKGDGDFGGETILPGPYPADPPAGSGGFLAEPVTVELLRPLSGEISCRLGTSQEQTAWPVKESRDLEGGGETAGRPPPPNR